MGNFDQFESVYFTLQLHDEKRVLDCLKKGVKIAAQSMDPGTKAQLYIELINKYMFFYERGHTGITETMLQELMKRVQDELPNLETGSDEADQIRRHFENTMSHAELRTHAAAKDPSVGPAYPNIVKV